MPTYSPTAAPTTQWISSTITTNTSNGYSAIAMNHDGSCVTIGTTDGLTLFSRQSLDGPFLPWTITGESTGYPFTSISMSITGQYQLALNVNVSSILLSSDCGDHWLHYSDNNTLSSHSIGTTDGWKYSAISENGFVILLARESGSIAVYNGVRDVNDNIWLPKFQVSIPFPKYVSLVGVSMNTIGDTMICLTSTGMIYLSRNYGRTWSTSYAQTLYEANTFTASRGTSLQNIIVSMKDINLFAISTDQGTYWSNVPGPNGPTNIWQSLVSSYSGQYVLGGMTHGPYDTISTAQDGVYYSNDYGQDWTMVFPLVNPVVAMNPAGNYMIAVSGELGSTQMYYHTQAGMWVILQSVS